MADKNAKQTAAQKWQDAMAALKQARDASANAKQALTDQQAIVAEAEKGLETAEANERDLAKAIAKARETGKKEPKRDRSALDDARHKVAVEKEVLSLREAAAKEAVQSVSIASGNVEKAEREALLAFMRSRGFPMFPVSERAKWSRIKDLTLEELAVLSEGWNQWKSDRDFGPDGFTIGPMKRSPLHEFIQKMVHLPIVSVDERKAALREAMLAMADQEQPKAA